MKFWQKKFTLSNYNPEDWIKMASDAGVGYIILTVKHHDGFCLYPSDVTDYDIEMTPYKGDPFKELVTACHKYGVKVGVYYSHRQDWREEAAAYMPKEYDGHYGKPESMVKPDFDKYMNEKALPQIEELLTRYGKIDLLWYDTPFDITYEQSLKFVEIVRRLQPQCIINGRVGHNLGDYGGLGDNEIPCSSVYTDLEMVATMNRTWGYKKHDHNWKSSKDILCTIIECASRGNNYVINVGPKSDGTIPVESVNIMNNIGKWMKINKESIIGTEANPFNDNFPWGYVTRKNDCLYLHLLREPVNRKITLKGLLSPIKKAIVLGKDRKLETINDGFSTLYLPYGLNYDDIPVIKITCDSPARFEKSSYINEGVISIPVALGRIIPGEKGSLRISDSGVTENFNSSTGKIKMNFILEEPGEYELYIYTNRHWSKSYADGCRIDLEIDENPAFKNILLNQDTELKNVRQHSYPESISKLGTVSFNNMGVKELIISVNNPGSFIKDAIYGEDLGFQNDNNVRFMRIELVKKE